MSDCLWILDVLFGVPEKQEAEQLDEDIDEAVADAMKIKLRDSVVTSGLGLLMDEQGNHWREFHVDYLAEQSDGVCAECGKGLSSGWMCLDGGEEICGEHVEFQEGQG